MDFENKLVTFVVNGKYAGAGSWKGDWEQAYPSVSSEIGNVVMDTSFN